MGAVGLRAVGPDDLPVKPRRAKTVSEAAASDDPRDLLVAMRTRVASAVEDASTPARDLAALTLRLMGIAKDIEALDAKSAGGAGYVEVPDGAFDPSSI